MAVRVETWGFHPNRGAIITEGGRVRIRCAAPSPPSNPNGEFDSRQQHGRPPHGSCRADPRVQGRAREHQGAHKCFVQRRRVLLAAADCVHSLLPVLQAQLRAAVFTAIDEQERDTGVHVPNANVQFIRDTEEGSTCTIVCREQCSLRCCGDHPLTVVSSALTAPLALYPTQANF